MQILLLSARGSTLFGSEAPKILGKRSRSNLAATTVLNWWAIGRFETWPHGWSHWGWWLPSSAGHLYLSLECEGAKVQGGWHRFVNMCSVTVNAIFIYIYILNNKCILGRPMMTSTLVNYVRMCVCVCVRLRLHIQIKQAMHVSAHLRPFTISTTHHLDNTVLTLCLYTSSALDMHFTAHLMSNVPTVHLYPHHVQTSWCPLSMLSRQQLRAFLPVYYTLSMRCHNFYIGPILHCRLPSSYLILSVGCHHAWMRHAYSSIAYVYTPKIKKNISGTAI